MSNTAVCGNRLSFELHRQGNTFRQIRQGIYLITRHAKCNNLDDAMLKAILFDIDNTLLYTEKANIRFYQEILVRSGYRKPSAGKIKLNFSLAMRDMLNILLDGKPKAEIAKVYEYARTIPFYDYDALKVPGGAIKALDALRSKYELAVVTSRIKAGAVEALSRKNMLQYFRTIVAYEDCLNPKPNPEPLLIALERLDIGPSNAVYIGDAKSDMQAASAAGVYFIAYGSKVPDARFRATRFNQIPRLLRSVERDLK